VADHLVLVGMMGAGKSTTARLASASLGWPLVDTDDAVELHLGAPIATVFATAGEAAFRREESRILRDALRNPVASVISVGGGAVLDPANRAALRSGGVVVWLRARPATLARRVGDGGSRPLLAHSVGRGPSSDGEPIAGREPSAGNQGDAERARRALERIDAERRELYQEVATTVVDVDDLSPDEVAGRVVRCCASASTRDLG
jgi:shikimate kinase